MRRRIRSLVRSFPCTQVQSPIQPPSRQLFPTCPTIEVVSTEERESTAVQAAAAAEPQLPLEELDHGSISTDAGPMYKAGNRIFVCPFQIHLRQTNPPKRQQRSPALSPSKPSTERSPSQTLCPFYAGDRATWLSHGMQIAGLLWAINDLSQHTPPVWLTPLKWGVFRLASSLADLEKEPQLCRNVLVRASPCLFPPLRDYDLLYYTQQHLFARPPGADDGPANVYTPWRLTWASNERELLYIMDDCCAKLILKRGPMRTKPCPLSVAKIFVNHWTATTMAGAVGRDPTTRTLIYENIQAEFSLSRPTDSFQLNKRAAASCSKAFHPGGPWATLLSASEWRKDSEEQALILARFIQTMTQHEIALCIHCLPDMTYQVWEVTLHEFSEIQVSNYQDAFAGTELPKPNVEWLHPLASQISRKPPLYAARYCLNSKDDYSSDEPPPCLEGLRYTVTGGISPGWPAQPIGLPAFFKIEGKKLSEYPDFLAWAITHVPTNNPAKVWVYEPRPLALPRARATSKSAIMSSLPAVAENQLFLITDFTVTLSLAPQPSSQLPRITTLHVRSYLQSALWVAIAEFVAAAMLIVRCFLTQEGRQLILEQIPNPSDSLRVALSGKEDLASLLTEMHRGLKVGNLLLTTCLGALPPDSVPVRHILNSVSCPSTKRLHERLRCAPGFYYMTEFMAVTPIYVWAGTFGGWKRSYVDNWGRNDATHGWNGPWVQCDSAPSVGAFVKEMRMLEKLFGGRTPTSVKSSATRRCDGIPVQLTYDGPSSAATGFDVLPDSLIAFPRSVEWRSNDIGTAVWLSRFDTPNSFPKKPYSVLCCCEIDTSQEPMWKLMNVSRIFTAQGRNACDPNELAQETSDIAGALQTDLKGRVRHLYLGRKPVFVVSIMDRPMLMLPLAVDLAGGVMGSETERNQLNSTPPKAQPQTDKASLAEKFPHLHQAFRTLVRYDYRAFVCHAFDLFTRNREKDLKYGFLLYDLGDREDLPASDPYKSIFKLSGWPFMVADILSRDRKWNETASEVDDILLLTASAMILGDNYQRLLCQEKEREVQIESRKKMKRNAVKASVSQHSTSAGSVNNSEPVASNSLDSLPSVCGGTGGGTNIVTCVVPPIEGVYTPAEWDTNEHERALNETVVLLMAKLFRRFFTLDTVQYGLRLAKREPLKKSLVRIILCHVIQLLWTEISTEDSSNYRVAVHLQICPKARVIQRLDFRSLLTLLVEVVSQNTPRIAALTFWFLGIVQQENIAKLNISLPLFPPPPLSRDRTQFLGLELGGKNLMGFGEQVKVSVERLGRVFKINCSLCRALSGLGNTPFAGNNLSQLVIPTTVSKNDANQQREANQTETDITLPVRQPFEKMEMVEALKQAVSVAYNQAVAPLVVHGLVEGTLMVLCMANHLATVRNDLRGVASSTCRYLEDAIPKLLWFEDLARASEADMCAVRLMKHFTSAVIDIVTGNASSVIGALELVVEYGLHLSFGDWTFQSKPQDGVNDISATKKQPAALEKAILTISYWAVCGLTHSAFYLEDEDLTVVFSTLARFIRSHLDQEVPKWSLGPPTLPPKGYNSRARLCVDDAHINTPSSSVEDALGGMLSAMELLDTKDLPESLLNSEDQASLHLDLCSLLMYNLIGGGCGSCTNYNDPDDSQRVDDAALRQFRELSEALDLIGGSAFPVRSDLLVTRKEARQRLRERFKTLIQHSALWVTGQNGVSAVLGLGRPRALRHDSALASVDLSLREENNLLLARGTDFWTAHQPLPVLLDPSPNKVFPPKVTDAATAPFACQQVACGEQHTLIVLKDGSMLGFGSTRDGQLGFLMQQLDNINDPRGSWSQSMHGGSPGPNCMERLYPLPERYRSMLATMGTKAFYDYQRGRSLYRSPDFSDENFHLPWSVCRPVRISLFDSDTGERLKVADIQCGSDFSMAVLEDGRLVTFGSANGGCLGRGNIDLGLPGLVLSPVGRCQQVSCGALHAAAVYDKEGRLYVWGQGDAGQLGVPSSHNWCANSSAANRSSSMRRNSSCSNLSTQKYLEPSPVELGVYVLDLAVDDKVSGAEVAINTITELASELKAVCGRTDSLLKQMSNSQRRAVRKSLSSGSLRSSGSFRGGGDSYARTPLKELFEQGCVTYSAACNQVIITMPVTPSPLLNAAMTHLKFPSLFRVAFTKVACGEAHTIAQGFMVPNGGTDGVTNSSEETKRVITLAWGQNELGQLGLGNLSNRPSIRIPSLDMSATELQAILSKPHQDHIGARLFPEPVQMPTGVVCKHLTTGGSSAAAITTDNQLYVWGCNDCRCLGISGNSSGVPVKVAASHTNIEDVAFCPGGPLMIARTREGALLQIGRPQLAPPNWRNHMITPRLPRVFELSTQRNWLQLHKLIHGDFKMYRLSTIPNASRSPRVTSESEKDGIRHTPVFRLPFAADKVALGIAHTAVVVDPTRIAGNSKPTYGTDNYRHVVLETPREERDQFRPNDTHKDTWDLVTKGPPLSLALCGLWPAATPKSSQAGTGRMNTAQAVPVVRQSTTTDPLHDPTKPSLAGQIGKTGLEGLARMGEMMITRVERGFKNVGMWVDANLDIQEINSKPPNHKGLRASPSLPTDIPPSRTDNVKRTRTATDFGLRQNRVCRPTPPRVATQEVLLTDLSVHPHRRLLSPKSPSAPAMTPLSRLPPQRRITQPQSPAYSSRTPSRTITQPFHLPYGETHYSQANSHVSSPHNACYAQTFEHLPWTPPDIFTNDQSEILYPGLKKNEFVNIGLVKPPRRIPREVVSTKPAPPPSLPQIPRPRIMFQGTSISPKGYQQYESACVPHNADSDDTSVSRSRAHSQARFQAQPSNQQGSIKGISNTKSVMTS